MNIKIIFSNVFDLLRFSFDSFTKPFLLLKYSSFGAAGNFATNYSKWSNLFPGIRSKLVTLRMNTLMPLVREFPLSCGVSAATTNSLATLLNQSNDTNDDEYTSNGVILVGGGMREQAYTYPNTYKFVLKQRRGFVKIALQTGASLVPAISFGENDVYKMEDVTSKFLIKLGIGYKQSDRSFSVFPNGRGLFQTRFGLLPIRHPITTVIGSPIHLPKIANPCRDLINQTHEDFCIKIKELFDEYKCRYVKNYEQVHLEIV